ncbi:DUF3718 domain-containing protein [Colwellia sp. RSH04]|uniref:DUF3718 domain-containing protein n=1 Tax=Colwellia sp. RSH04 TaxID=2305464 RepID=UPI000E58A7AC|nr:DUF3718 domain-containing protein [Colwellia sp. RSH04]RHW77737.1 DUF3718 domain-containing protein [Colwellia sp. RSH04]
MKTAKSLTLGITATLSLLVMSLPSQAATPSYMETALISVCKAAQSNSVQKLNQQTKTFRLKKRTVALGVMCNGEDIISFAETHGADKTAAKLQKSISNVSITDIAAVSKINVSFKL